jgi:hypothetical protein
MVRTGELESPNTTFSRWRLCRFAYVRKCHLVNQPGFEPGMGLRLPIKSRVPSAARRHWSLDLANPVGLAPTVRRLRAHPG